MAIEYTKTDVTSGYNLSKLNQNFTDLEIALDDALSRTGQSPNQMQADIDLNDNDLLNVKTLDVNNISYQGQTLTPSTLVITNAMLKSQYDPTNNGSDVFNRVNHTGPVVWPVDNRTALKALDTTKFKVSYLKENPRNGIFEWKSGDYSAQIAYDPSEGVYIKANAISASVGAWVRVGYVKAVDARWFGVIGDYNTDDTAAFVDTLAFINSTGATLVGDQMNIRTVGGIDLPEGIRTRCGGGASVYMDYH